MISSCRANIAEKKRQGIRRAFSAEMVGEHDDFTSYLAHQKHTVSELWPQPDDGLKRVRHLSRMTRE